MEKTEVGRALADVAKRHAHLPDYRHPETLTAAQRNRFRLKYPAKAAKPKWKQSSKTRKEEASWRDDLIEGIMQALGKGLQNLAKKSPRNIRRGQTRAYFDKHLKGVGPLERQKRLAAFAQNKGKPLTQMKALRGGRSF